MKAINTYITEKFKINKNGQSVFQQIISLLNDYDSPYLENTLHLPGEACIDVYYDKKKDWRILSIAPNDDNTKLALELSTDDGDEKEVEIDEKKFLKLFSDEDIEEIINTLTEN